MLGTRGTQRRCVQVCTDLQTISFLGAFGGSAELILAVKLSSRASEVGEGTRWACGDGPALGPGRLGRVVRRSRRRHGATDGADGHKLRDEAYSDKEIRPTRAACALPPTVDPAPSIVADGFCREEFGVVMSHQL